MGGAAEGPGVGAVDEGPEAVLVHLEAGGVGQCGGFKAGAEAEGGGAEDGVIADGVETQVVELARQEVGQVGFGAEDLGAVGADDHVVVARLVGVEDGDGGAGGGHVADGGAAGTHAAGHLLDGDVVDVDIVVAAVVAQGDVAVEAAEGGLKLLVEVGGRGTALLHRHEGAGVVGVAHDTQLDIGAGVGSAGPEGKHQVGDGVGEVGQNHNVVGCRGPIENQGLAAAVHVGAAVGYIGVGGAVAIEDIPAGIVENAGGAGIGGGRVALEVLGPGQAVVLDAGAGSAEEGGEGGMEVAVAAEGRYAHHVFSVGGEGAVGVDAVVDDDAVQTGVAGEELDDVLGVFVAVGHEEFGRRGHDVAHGDGGGSRAVGRGLHHDVVDIDAVAVGVVDGAAEGDVLLFHVVAELHLVVGPVAARRDGGDGEFLRVGGGVGGVAHQAHAEGAVGAAFGVEADHHAAKIFHAGHDGILAAHVVGVEIEAFVARRAGGVGVGGGVGVFRIARAGVDLGPAGVEVGGTGGPVGEVLGEGHGAGRNNAAGGAEREGGPAAGVATGAVGAEVDVVDGGGHEAAQVEGGVGGGAGVVQARAGGEGGVVPLVDVAVGHVGPEDGGLGAVDGGGHDVARTVADGAAAGGVAEGGLGQEGQARGDGQQVEVAATVAVAGIVD